MSPESKGAASPEGQKPAKKLRLGKILPAIIGIVVIVLVLVAGTWGMWGGTDYPSVKDVLGDQGKYLNKYVEVRGTVKLQSLDVNNTTFVLSEGSSDIRVNYTGALPANFEEGKDVVVKGTLRNLGGLVLVSKEIVVGCASKY
jgi:cytochrome c-type biogenesis protein CcmE